jgi:hypothetical protein
LSLALLKVRLQARMGVVKTLLAELLIELVLETFQAALCGFE